MTYPHTILTGAALAATAMVFVSAPLRVNASGNNCEPYGCFSGGPGCNCIEVIGASRRVDRVKGQGWIPGANSNVSHVYHFELWAKNWRHNTPDKVWDKSITGGTVESEWVKVNRSFPDGTGVCSRLWEKVDGRWKQAGKMACVKITR
jgi:hypothetical protein